VKYTQFRAFEKHLQSAAPLHFSQIYCFIGKDSQERGLALDTLKKSLKIDEAIRFESTAEKEFLRDLDTMSLFQEKRLLVFQLGEKLSKSISVQIEKRMGNLPSSTYVVFSAETLSGKTSFYQALEKAGVILEMGEEKPWEKERSLAEWLLDRASRAGKTLSPDAVNLLARGCGSSLALLSGEWEKLLTYSGDQKAIHAQDVEAICTLDPIDSTWLLGESILRQDGKTALEVATRMVDQGHAVIALLRQLRHQMMTALQLACAKETGQIEAVRAKFPYLKGQMFDRQLAACSQFGSKRLARAIEKIDDYEFKAKDAWDDPKLLLNMLILRLIE
jgi:DNA polymerase III subunit delta